MSGHRLRLLAGRLAVCRLPAAQALPAWALTPGGELLSLTRTAGELSVVCPEERVPADVAHRGGWRALEVAGPLDLSLTGVLAALAVPLAAAGVPLFPLATHDTDYLLVPETRLPDAVAALTAAGHRVA